MFLHVAPYLVCFNDNGCWIYAVCCLLITMVGLIAVSGRNFFDRLMEVMNVCCCDEP